jgi:opacity protein-like surface antigen
MRSSIFAAALVLAAAAGSARADDNNYLQTNGLLYIGAGVSKDKIDGITHTGVPFDDLDKTSWKAFAGFRPIRPFALELDYMDLGNRTYTYINGVNQHEDARAFAGYAVGFLPLPLPYFDLYAKAGAARWKFNGNQSTAGQLPPSSFFAFSDEGTSFAWGVGAQAQIKNIGGRLEWEHFEIPNTDNGAKVFTLALVISLL